MNEIKHRAKNIYSGEWVYGYACKLSGKDWFIMQFDKDVDKPSFVPVDEKTLCVFTGHKDIRNKEIYTRDIIRMVYIHDEGGGWKSNSKEVGVVYVDEHWGVKFDCADWTQRVGASWKLRKSTFEDACDVEIIGVYPDDKEKIKVVIRDKNKL